MTWRMWHKWRLWYAITATTIAIFQNHWQSNGITQYVYVCMCIFHNIYFFDVLQLNILDTCFCCFCWMFFLFFFFKLNIFMRWWWFVWNEQFFFFWFLCFWFLFDFVKFFLFLFLFFSTISISFIQHIRCGKCKFTIIVVQCIFVVVSMYFSCMHVCVYVNAYDTAMYDTVNGSVIMEKNI